MECGDGDKNKLQSVEKSSNQGGPEYLPCKPVSSDFQHPPLVPVIKARYSIPFITVELSMIKKCSHSQ